MSQLPAISALGTQFYIEIFDKGIDQTKFDATYSSIQFLLSTFEENYSRFKETSFVSRLNRSKTLINPPPQFIELLTLGLKLYDGTDGIFNLLVGETLDARGYDAHYSFVASLEPKSIPNPHEAIILEVDKITLMEGLIDLGGYGKGFVIDLIAEHLQSECGLEYFLINGGGDIYGTSQQGAPFTIYLEHPLETQTYLGTTEILNQGFAASSPHKRSWIHNGTTYHHIVNPKPHAHRTPLCDASFIISRNCVEADAFATIALMIETDELTNLAVENQFAFATFTLPTTLNKNAAFIVQNL